MIDVAEEIKQTTSELIIIDPTAEEVKKLESEINTLREKEQILLKKFDSKSAKLDWAFNHPVKFMLGRIYHQVVKRDQKNVQS